MAIDTAAKRVSALDFEQVWETGGPIPDGTVSAADRQHALFSYSGIAMVSGVVGFGEIVSATLRANIEAHERYTVKAGLKQNIESRRGKDRLGNG